MCTQTYYNKYIRKKYVQLRKYTYTRYIFQPKFLVGDKCLTSFYLVTFSTSTVVVALG